jgi:hypothetical protein
MKIINSIMPTSDVKVLAANGQKLRVAVTKTSAQGRVAQSTTPNLMCFSTDENSVWFNGRKYGIYILKEYESLSSGSQTSTIQSFLGEFTYNVWSSAQGNGNIVLVKNNSTVMVASVYVNSEANKLTLHMNDGEAVYYVSITYSTGSGYSISEIGKLNLISEGSIIDVLTSSSSNKPLSAAMGKKLQDEKLAKSDVVNNLTTTSTSKALSAAQGKVLNDRILGLGDVYRVKGTKANLSDVLALTDAKIGDVWNVTNAFTLSGKPYPANTNVVCITATSSSDHDEGNWDPLGGTVNLSTYVLKSDIVDNIVSPDTNKPLSANQGKLLGAKLDELKAKVDLYKLPKSFTSGSLGNKAEVDSLLGAYSTFSSAVTAGKLIYGIYNDSSSLAHTVTFTAYSSTNRKQIIMYAVINPTTMVRISANYEGTSWVTATIEQDSLGEGTIIE